MFDIGKYKKKAEKFATDTNNKLDKLTNDQDKTKLHIEKLQKDQQETEKKLDYMIKYVHCTKIASYSDSNQLEQIKICGEILESECQI